MSSLCGAPLVKARTLAMMRSTISGDAEFFTAYATCSSGEICKSPFSQKSVTSCSNVAEP